MNEFATDILTPAILGLTREQKIGALRRFNEDFNTTEVKIFAAGIVLIVVFFILLKLYQKAREWKELEFCESVFKENIERFELDDEEQMIIRKIAKYAELKRIDSIFSMPKAYDIGSAILMQKTFSSGKSLVERQHLNQKIVSLKQKIGLKKTGNSPGSNNETLRRKGLSSTQIPAGRTVLLSRIHSKDASPVAATIFENNQFELKLETKEQVKAKPGEVWRVIYQFGNAVWKFDSLIISCEENEMSLSHTDNVLFVNRRRYVHANVDLHGYIARFPATRNIDDEKMDMLPQFISTRIIELSGPGMLLAAPLKMRPNDRVLVIFELSKNRIVQSIAEVRHSDRQDSGYITAVEMININESCINELITATNNFARESSAIQQEAAVSGDTDIK